MSTPLIERLEKEIKHYDRRVVASLSGTAPGGYDHRGADLRDLLEQAVTALRACAHAEALIGADCS